MRRSHLELVLLEKIMEKNTELALRTIELIQLDKNSRLDSITNNGKSFLNYALAFGVEKVAQKLLALQFNDPNILFGIDGSGKTCLFFAAKEGYVDIFRTLLDKSREANPNTPGYKLWLKPDEDGNTPLHIAIENRKISIVELLLQEIYQDTDYINYINSVNREGNTPLHIACSIKSHSIDLYLLMLLVQHGADLTVWNEEQETPLAFILGLYNEQVKLFQGFKEKNEVDEDQKQLFLQLYRHCVIASGVDTNVLNQYYHLAIQHSLKTYTGAKLEFDDTIKIPHCDRVIPDDILKLIPRYTNKLELARQSQIPEVFSSSYVAVSMDLNEKNHQLLMQDRITMKLLLENIEKCQVNLQNKPDIILSGHQLSGLITLAICLFIYLPIEIWLGTYGSVYDRSDYLNNNSKTHENYLISTLLFGIGGGFLIVAYALNAFSKWIHNENSGLPSIQNKISLSEWKPMIDSIESALLEKLQFLEKKELQDKQAYPELQIDYLPVHQQTIRDLENLLARYNKESESVYQANMLLTYLHFNLDQIKGGLLVTNKPFSRFFKSAYESHRLKPDMIELRVEEIEEDSMEGEEKLLIASVS